MIVPPLVFYAEIVLVLALAGLAAALVLFLQPDPDPGGCWRLLARFRERQEDLATSLGMRTRAWLLLRAATTVVALAAGSLSSLWTVSLLGGLLGWFGLPWLLAGRMARRKLAMERALVALVREISNLMQQSNLALDRALREVARNPSPELQRVLRPLRSERPVPECLVEVVGLARSPMASTWCIALLVARAHDPAAFVSVSEQVLGPVMEVAVRVHEENHATLAQQRTAAIAIGVVMGSLFYAIMRVQTMHDFYASFSGQLVLLVVVVLYLGLVWLIGQIARPIPWTRWDEDAVRREMEGLFA